MEISTDYLGIDYILFLEIRKMNQLVFLHSFELT